jgi:hypothetical protein
MNATSAYAYKGLIMLRNTNTRQAFRILTVLAVAFVASGLHIIAASAASLTTASVGLSDSRPSQTSVNYTFTGSSVTVYATTATGTTVPTSFDSSVAAVAISASSTYINSSTAGWTLDKTTNGTLKYTNATGITPSTTTGATFIMNGITNSSIADTGYFLQFSTYNNVDCTTTPVDNTTVTFINTAGQAVSLTVDPSLAFTVAGAASGATCNGTTANVTTTASTIPLGTPTTSTNRIGVQNLSVTTNAGSGYTVYTRYTAKPTYNVTNTIADASGSNTTPAAFAAAGTEAFGYTTNDATLGTGTANRFTSPASGFAAFTTSNAEVAYNNAAASSQTTCVAQQVGISGTTPAGTYTTTVIYTATPLY